MERFLRNFEQLGLTTNTLKANTEAKGFGVKDRWCWVVRDKDKFEQLIRELSHLNSRLHDLVPDKANARSILALTEEDLSDIRSIPHLKLISEAAPGIPHVLEAVKRAIQTANQNRVLQRLWFRQIDDRRETVSGAHAGTFSWALRPPKRALEWDDLCDWLRAEKSGIYWLAGKAGSGKSTLMKYVLGHSRTQELLKEWAGASDFTVADFFFYHLGMPEQKSQEGLFQGLLYQVLSQHYDCIKTVMPKMWKEALATEDDPKGEISMPSVREMQTGLLDFAKSQTKKLFLFIDGLDEYDGRSMDAATFIEELGKLEGVKILVSSRPLPDFVAAFQGKPKMNLQDLTRRDIETYVDDTITHHPYMTKLTLEDPNGSSELVRDFISKASGVFLWVILACRSVLEGFAAFDSVSDLKARVHELPPELEDLFRHMLHRIDPRCREQSVRLLRLVFDNQTKGDACSIPTLGLALGERRDFRYHLGEPIEIQQVTLANEPNVLCVCGNNKKHDLFLDSSVVFMHRSVYEFLSMPDVWDSEWMQIDNDRFHSHAILSTLWIEVVGMGQQMNMAHKNICINNALLHIYTYVIQHVSREHVKRHDSVMRVEGRYGAKYELVEDDYQLIRHAAKGKRAEVDKWYAMWDILYPDKPRPSSPFKDGLLGQMLAIARDAHRFYREHIGDGSLTQLLARQSTSDGLAPQDLEEAIEELLFDGERVRAMVQLMASREPGWRDARRTL
ncbi:hypothetical protein CEP53_006157 [Fusarium sp. AF-6]|nr:hypothetical protein CEP53_006157 [Fusarium sp. AF-6]